MRSSWSSRAPTCRTISISIGIVLVSSLVFAGQGWALSAPQSNSNEAVVITHAAGRMGKLLALQIHEASKLSGTPPPTIRAIVRSDAEALSVQCDLGGMTMAGGETKPIPVDWLETVVVEDIRDEADLAKLRAAFSGAGASILCDASHNEIVWGDSETDDAVAAYSIVVPAADSRDLSERLLAEIAAAAASGPSLRHVILRSSMGLTVGASTEAGRAMGGELALDGPRKAEAALRATSLGFTILRLGALTDDAGMVPLAFGVGDSILNKQVDSGEGTRRPPIVSRADAARLTTFLLRQGDAFKGMTIDCSWHPKFGRNSVGTEEATQAAGRQDLKSLIMTFCGSTQQYIGNDSS